MAIETKIINIERQQSVQELPKVRTPNGISNAAPILLGTTMRGPILPAHGTRERELSLLQLYRHDYNALFKSAIAGLVKRVQSTPWELQGESLDTDVFQHVLLNADFGRGWESFVSKVIIAFSRYDGGAYIELIGSGHPLTPMTGPLTGIAILDSLRCMPTGDPEFPVIYMDVLGSLHVMHHTRVVRFVDMPDEDEMSYGYGECALSRCAAAVTRDILMNRYVERSLDDNPAPGLVVFKNISEKQVNEALAKLHEERSTDFGGEWGRVVRLYGLHADSTPEVVSYAFSQPPEKFDFEKYKTLNVKEIALGIGLDIQDLWELTGGNIGSATQSEILHQKSKGKALGRALKGLERAVNQVLPEELEFRFQYTDAEEDQEQATIAQTWAGITTSLTMQLTPDEQRRLLANQVEAIHDVVTDPDGNVIRLDDADVVTPAQAQGDPPTLLPDIVVDDTEGVGKSIESDAYAVLQFSNNDQLIAIQRFLKDNMVNEKIEWQIPATFHITLVYAPNVDSDQLFDAVHDLSFSDFEVYGNRLSVFNNGDSRALHIVIDKSSMIAELQRKVYDRFQSMGIEVSEFSLPDVYNPHITLAYLPNGVSIPDYRFEFSANAKTIMFSRDDYEPFAEVTAIGFKSINSTQLSFKQAFTEIVSAGLDGVVSKAAVRMALRAQLQQHGQRAYLDGLEDGGVLTPELDDEAKQSIATWRARQVDYIQSFVDQVYEEQWTPQQIDQRATMWINKSLNTLYHEGLAAADAQARYMWVVNPIKEHCRTCLRLNGQIHRMKEYVKRGLLPQARSLECGGWLCGCSLVKTMEQSRGSLRAVPYIRGAKEHEHWELN